MPPAGMGGYLPDIEPGLYEQSHLAQLLKPAQGPLTTMDVKTLGAASPWAAVLGAVSEGMAALKNRANEERLRREAENEQATKHYLNQLSSILSDPTLTPVAKAEISRRGSEHLASMVDQAARGTKEASSFKRILRELGGAGPLPGKIDPLVEANRLRVDIEQHPEWSISNNLNEAQRQWEAAKQAWERQNPGAQMTPTIAESLVAPIAQQLEQRVGGDAAERWLKYAVAQAAPLTLQQQMTEAKAGYGLSMFRPPATATEPPPARAGGEAEPAAVLPSILSSQEATSDLVPRYLSLVVPQGRSGQTAPTPRADVVTGAAAPTGSPSKAVAYVPGYDVERFSKLSAAGLVDQQERQARLIAGGPAFPIAYVPWSPDERDIGFWDLNTKRKIDESVTPIRFTTTGEQDAEAAAQRNPSYANFFVRLPDGSTTTMRFQATAGGAYSPSPVTTEGLPPGAQIIGVSEPLVSVGPTGELYGRGASVGMQEADKAAQAKVNSVVQSATESQLVPRDTFGNPLYGIAIEQVRKRTDLPADVRSRAEEELMRRRNLLSEEARTMQNMLMMQYEARRKKMAQRLP